MVKTSYILVFYLLLFASTSWTQIGIGTPDPKADLDVKGDIGIEPLPFLNHQADGITSIVTVDVNNEGAGAALFINSSGNYSTANASDANKLPCVALAVETGLGNKKILHYGYYRNDAWNWTIGGLIYLDVNEGGLTQIKPTGTSDIVQVLGFATYHNRIMFNPSYITSQEFIVNNKPNADFTHDPEMVFQFMPITFNAALCFDPDPWDQEFTEYLWDFDGDGIYEVSTSDVEIEKTFTVEGFYNVALKIVDFYGIVDIEVKVVEVHCNLDCDDGIDCTANVLNEDDCICQNIPENEWCDDGDPCTDNICDPELGCTFPPANGVPCDDGNPCTENDVCVNGVCTGTFIICDDGDPCTSDSCDPALGCVYTPLANGSACDDGDPCTENETCVDGNCGGGTLVDCDDQDVYTLDLCDSQSGCYYVTNDAPVASFTAQPVEADQNEDITFDASSSYDPNEALGDQITLYEWDWDNDGTYDESSENPVTMHVFLSSGQHVIYLRVTDSQGLTDESSEVINIF